MVSARIPLSYGSYRIYMLNETVKDVYMVQLGASVSGFMHNGRGYAVLEESLSWKSGSIALLE